MSTSSGSPSYIGIIIKVQMVKGIIIKVQMVNHTIVNIVLSHQDVGQCITEVYSSLGKWSIV